MIDKVSQFKNKIAKSIFQEPCTLLELREREILKSHSHFAIDKQLSILEAEEALYFKGKQMLIRVTWAKENLKK